MVGQLPGRRKEEGGWCRLGITPDEEDRFPLLAPYVGEVRQGEAFPIPPFP